MPFYKFEKNDLFYNRIKTFPSIKFNIYKDGVVYNNDTQYTGDFGSNVKHVPSGNISLYEMNVDRPSGQLVYPFVTKQGSLTSFKTVSTSNFNSDFSYGETITGTYPLSSSISSDRFAAGVNGSAAAYYRDALKNTLNDYTKNSPHYSFSSSLGNKDTQQIRIISIPSIFYGSSLKKGSCSLKFFVSGSLIAELKDDNRTGELKQVSASAGTASGSVGGVVMYNQGFIILTGSWDLDASHTADYGRGSATAPKWVDFAFTGSTATYSSFEMAFSGTNYVPTMTMFAHMPKGELNHSNNPTFLSYGQSASLTPITSSISYKENSTLSIKNIAKTNFIDPTGSFEKTTYINRVGIYDKYKNLIAIAKLATPVRKRETDELTLKLKLDF